MHFSHLPNYSGPSGLSKQHLFDDDGGTKLENWKSRAESTIVEHHQLLSRIC